MSRQPSSSAQEAAARNALRAEIPVFIRDGVYTGALIFLLSAAAVVIVYQSAVTSKLKEALNQLRPQAEYLASLVDLRAHAWLATSQQTNSQPHTALTQRLQNMRQYYPGMGKLFTGRYKAGKISVILDTLDPARGRTEPHYVARPLAIDLPPDAPELKAIQERQTYVTDEPAFKGEGKFLGVIVPLPNPDQSARDFLYLDSSYETVAAGLIAAKHARDISLLAAAIFAVIAGMTVFSWRSQSQFKQILAVTKLREGEELFRTTYEMSPVAMCLTRTDERILRANKAFCDFLGYTENELVHLQPSDYTHAEDLKKDQPLLENLQSNQISQYQSERRYLRKDGRIVWGLASVAIVRDSDANISHYMTQVVEITKRKLAEETLSLSQERLALAADAGKVGMWDCDLTTGRTVWNDVMHVIFQTQAETFSPTLEAQEGFVHPDDRTAAKAEFQRCLQAGTPYEQEYRIVQHDGSIRHVKASAIIFKDESGKPIRAVGTSIDITAEKEESGELIRAKESALAADKAKSEFLAVMSHEIRTPLNGVLGFVSMLKNTPLDSEQLSYIETMESSGQGLLMLVNDILDLSKIESREIHVEPSTFEVRPFIRK
ncbi:MAG: PAS domain S-box protein, partial [Terrimicrobiaceae bacterium]